MESRIWIFFVALAGLCWGTYVPFVAAGGKELKSSYDHYSALASPILIAILFRSVFWARRSHFQLTARFWPLWLAWPERCASRHPRHLEFNGPTAGSSPLSRRWSTRLQLSGILEPALLRSQTPHWTSLSASCTGLAGLVLFSKEYGESLHGAETCGG